MTYGVVVASTTIGSTDRSCSRNRPKIVKTPSQHLPVVFLIEEQHTPASLLQTLLIMAGIESNPGPSQRKWFCTVCKLVIRDNQTSVKCNSCNEWCHLKVCSGLNHHRHWNSSFTANCCATIATQPTMNHTPATQQPASNLTSFKILQLNCNGLRGKLDEIGHFMEKHNILVAALQETKLNPNVNLQLNGYTITRIDRERDRGGGLAFIIKDSVKFRVVNLPTTPPNTFIEQQSIAISSNSSEATLVNVYIPPHSSCPGASPADIQHLLGIDDSIIMGDFNAHHSTWYSTLNDDARGITIADQIEQSNFGILNEDTPTRVSSDTISSPDITLASPSFLSSTEWSTMPALSSDHLPIIVELQQTVTKIQADCKTYTNFAKADWPSFRAHTEDKFARVRRPRNIYSYEKTFRGIVKRAARIYIPAGRFKEIRPNFPTSAAKLADQRDRLRETDPNNPLIQQLSREIRKTVDDHKRNLWREHLDKCSTEPGTKSLWKTVKRLSNPQKSANNIAITFNGAHVHDDKKCANQFNRLFTTHPTSGDKSTRNTMRTIHKMRATDEVSFEQNQVESAIKSTKSSKALGPDGISPIMMKNLGPIGISFLTILLNLSLNTLLIPGVWKAGRIIPLPKPNKPEDQGSSYRPISLLSPVAKLIEALLLPLLSNHLQLAQHQHGFRKGHSTTTALHTITDQIQSGLNQQRPNLRTIVVALDLSRAFDTVSHGLLLQEILQTTVPTRVKKWLSNYLRGRQTFVEFRGSSSKHRKLKQGVPQGGVLSPLLFNFYMSTLPPPPAGVEIVSYADDISVLCTGNDIQESCNKINGYLDTISQWLSSKNLELSPGKSSATIFTTWNREMYLDLDVRVGNSRIPTVNKPRILGVIFDNLMTFSAHTRHICEKLKSRNNVLKSLAGSSWGKDKETLITTFKAIGRSVLNYAAPIWSSQISETSWNKLQVSQNAALRVATGCHMMTSNKHLHAETKMLPVKQHNEMLSKQYLLKCHLEEHPCHSTTVATPEPRHIRKSLTRTYSSDIAQHLPEGGLNAEAYKRSLNSIHTDTVTRSVADNFNHVLNSIPPPVNEEERLLPRTTRTTLAQLRSGWCRLLNHYLNRLDPETPDACPDCGIGPHDVRHLFECPKTPTHLSVESLWTKPKEAAAFLNLLTNEDD